MVETNLSREFQQWKNELSQCMENLEEKREIFFKNLNRENDIFFEAIQKYVKTGEIDAKALKLDKKELSSIIDEESSIKGKSRKKKTVLSEITEENVLVVKIKKEKISAHNESVSSRSSITSTEPTVPENVIHEIKNEIDDMPAPTWIPPKKKTKDVKPVRASVRSTRTKGKKPSVRDSDVVVQETVVTTINLSDTEESDVEKPQENKKKITRSTRTKTKKLQSRDQRDSGTETDSECTRSTRTKTRGKKETDIENEKTSSKKEEKIENGEVEETRSTRTKTIRKGKKVEEEKENKEETSVESTPSTRTKTKKVAEKKAEEEAFERENESETVKSKTDNENIKESKSKRNRTQSSSDEMNDNKRSKSISPVQDIEAGNATRQTVYEDAQSILSQQPEKPQQNFNSTYVYSVPSNLVAAEHNTTTNINTTVTLEAASSNAANCTVIVDKPQFNIFDKKSTNTLLTDDDSIEAKTPPKKAPIHKAGKEVFSPYEKTTIKKKVEAFEKLRNVSEIPVKANLRSNTPSSIKEKAKIFTPLVSRFLPSSSSTSKISKVNSTSNESLLAMKSAQKESRDRQKKLQEREQAQKKKEAMLLAQTEAKKKLNEEKQLKALQQRKALEAEKLKQLEVQKQKEAKLRQRELEREEYLQKQKAEREKQRLAQKKKLMEMQAHRQQILEEQARNPPIYMTTKPPKLPTKDCYDSDDQEYKKVVPPSWCVGEYARTKQLAMLAAGERIKNTLFCRHAQTPDLTEIFEVIDPKKLKRSSSVLWRKPPRYTMMPDLNETKFEEDDEIFEDD